MTDIISRLARHAAEFGAEFVLKVHKTRAVRATFRLGKSDPFAHNLHRRMFVASHDYDIDVCLRDLLRQVERAMGVSWETRTPAVDPNVERLRFLEALTDDQRATARRLCNNWRDFRFACAAQQRAADEGARA
jgi:hypothetical protein